MQRYLCPLFQNQAPHFLLSLFSENYLNPQVSISKTVNKHTVDYQPSPSQLISRIRPLIFLWTPKGFISPESFLNFFLNLYIPPWLRKSFKFIVLNGVSATFLLICFLHLKESTCEARKNVFYFTSKVLFVFEINKF